MDDAGGAESPAEQAGSVAGAVVGEDALDGDAVLGEESIRALPEGGRVLLAFVGQNLAVREPGVIVDGCANEAVADHGTAAPTHVGCGLPIACGLLAGHDPMSAAVWNVAELLDVDVDQFAGM